MGVPNLLITYDNTWVGEFPSTLDLDVLYRLRSTQL